MTKLRFATHILLGLDPTLTFSLIIVSSLTILHADCTFFASSGTPTSSDKPSESVGSGIRGRVLMRDEARGATLGSSRSSETKFGVEVRARRNQVARRSPVASTSEAGARLGRSERRSKPGGAKVEVRSQVQGLGRTQIS